MEFIGLDRLIAVILMLIGMLFPSMASAQSGEYMFGDPECERIVRDALERPSGPIFREDLASVTGFTNTGVLFRHSDGSEVCPVLDVSILRDLPNLQRLNLQGVEEIDLSLLSENRTLETLFLYTIEQPVDLSALPANLSLRMVTLYDVDALHLDAVLSNPSLEVFSYYAKDELSSISISIERNKSVLGLELANTTKEELLMIRAWCAEEESGWPQYSFVAPEFSEEDLALIPPQIGTTFYGADFSDFSALSIMGDEGRTALALYDCKNVDPSTLPKEPAITHLTLDRCGLTDLEFAREMPRLDSLWLSGNEIRDISPLADMPWLEALDVSGNPIADYTPLYSLKERLSRLTVDDSISQEQLDALREALPNVSIRILNTPDDG